MKTIVEKMAQEAAVIIHNGDAYQVMSCDFDESQFLDDEDAMGIHALDEESGNETFIAYSEVDLKRDTFYKLVEMDEKDWQE